MTKHLFVTGVMTLGLVMLAGAHASATSNRSSDVLAVSGAAGKTTAGIVLARRGSSSATEAGDDRGRRHGGHGADDAKSTGASLDRTDGAFTVARRSSSSSEVENETETERAGDRHRQRRGGRTQA